MRAVNGTSYLHRIQLCTGKRRQLPKNVYYEPDTFFFCFGGVSVTLRVSMVTMDRFVSMGKTRLWFHLESND